MSTVASKRKRSGAPARNVKKPRRFKKQANYHSSSESDSEEDEAGQDFAPVSMEDSDEEADVTAATSGKTAGGVKLAAADPADESDDAASDDDQEASEVVQDAPSEASVIDLTSSDSDSDTVNTDTNSTALGTRKKRNDPTAFATSMSKILSTKLTTSKRADPVLSRSAAAADANTALADSKLEAKARAKLRAEKKAASERGRVQDVLGLETEGVSASTVQEREKRLKKTAQRGVVKLFNAVRAAQVQGERARDEARREGVVGMAQREERVSEMSKAGFLELIAKGGKKGVIEEG